MRQAERERRDRQRARIMERISVRRTNVEILNSFDLTSTKGRESERMRDRHTGKAGRERDRGQETGRTGRG